MSARRKNSVLLTSRHGLKNVLRILTYAADFFKLQDNTPSLAAYLRGGLRGSISPVTLLDS